MFPETIFKFDPHRTAFFHLDVRYLHGGDNVSFEQARISPWLSSWHMEIAELPVLENKHIPWVRVLR
jgi:hypothetical protein